MEEGNNRTSKAAGDMRNEHSKPVKEGGEIQDGKVENNDEQRRVSSDSSSGYTVGNSSRGESKASESKSLNSVQLCEGDLPGDFDESSHFLSDVPVEYSMAFKPLQPAEELKGKVKAVHDEFLKGTSAEVQIRIPGGPSKLEVSSTSVTQSISFFHNPSPPQQKLRPVKNGNNVCDTEYDKHNSPHPKPLSIRPVLKSSDGYNWRKYGQKQVKSPEGSRSYYRCTFSDCYAKKIECCDLSKCLIETVYRSHHTHDSPQKVNCTKESSPALPIAPATRSNDTVCPSDCSNNPVQANMSKQPLPGIDEIPETKKQEASDSDETIEVNMAKYVDGADCRKRLKKNSTVEVESPSKPEKKPKYVVHAAGDVGISGDGYRWRKYGQKMVKGNPHPRNYYRCTSAGCPVRKHIERAVDNTNAVVITYKGVHDHDTPVPRKRSGPKSAVSSADSPITLDDFRNKTDQSHESGTQWSVDKKGELTGEPLKEKASGSARSQALLNFTT
ncbi:WRKY transcription factor [Orobanche gracilis]